MKKSFDYFKTLKNMSDRIGSAFEYIYEPDKYKKEIMLFCAIRGELSENLSQEFVAPIERNDIYNISSRLFREMLSLDYLCLLEYKNEEVLRDLLSSDILKLQGKLIYGLSAKDFIGSFRNVTMALNTVNSKRNHILSRSHQCLRVGENILLKYAFFDRLLRFTEDISITLDELTRVIINNM